MTENTIHFELVSPEEKLVSEPVAMATIPGAEGEMGVMAGHASFVAALKPGVVELNFGDAEARKIFVAGGFADITGSNCTILAEEATNVADLDQEALEKQRENLTQDLGLAEEEADKIRIQGAIDLTAEKIAAITGTLAA